MTFTPHSPQALGLEWFPDGQGAQPIGGSAQSVAFLLRSSVTEQINRLDLAHAWSGAPAGHGRMWVDVYRYGQENAGAALTEFTYYPNGDISIGAWDGSSTTSPQNTNIFQYVDSDDQTAPIGATGPADQIFRPGHANPGGSYTYSPYRMSFGTAGFSPSNRPLALYVDIRCGVFAFQGGLISSSLTLCRNGADVATIAHPNPGTITFPGHTGWFDITHGPFYINPHTDEPWSAQDVIDFDDPTKYGLGIDFNSTNGSVAVTMIRMRWATIPDTRVAWGSTPAIASPPTGIVSTGEPFLLRHTDVIDNDFAKTTGVTYLAVVRRLDDGDPFSGKQTLAPSVRWISSKTENPSTQGTEVSVEIDSSGRLVTVGAATTKTYPAIWSNTADVTSVDTEPYHLITGLPVLATGNLTAKQRITTIDARTYATVRAVVGVIPDSIPTANLLISLRRVSDNALIGGAASISYTEVVEQSDPTGVGFDQVRYYEIIAELSAPATVAAATQYDVVFSTGSTVNPWLIASVGYVLPAGITGDRSAAGTAYAQTTAQASDLAAALLDRPSPPGTIVAAVRNLPIATTGQAASCDPGSFPVVDVIWSGTVLGTSFGYYELQRLVGGVWESFARGTTEVASAFSDYRAPRSPVGTAVQYRVRVRRADGAVSTWTTSTAVTCFQQPGTIHFGSNSLPALSTGFMLVGPGYSWDFVTSQRRSLHELWGRDYAVDLRPLEQRGVVWPFSILVWASLGGYPSGGQGRAAFTSIRSVVEAYALPNWAVFTDGERLFASLATAGPFTRDAETRVYIASLTASEVDGTETVVEF